MRRRQYAALQAHGTAELGVAHCRCLAPRPHGSPQHGVWLPLPLARCRWRLDLLLFRRRVCGSIGLSCYRWRRTPAADFLASYRILSPLKDRAVRVLFCESLISVQTRSYLFIAIAEDFVLKGTQCHCVPVLGPLAVAANGNLYHSRPKAIAICWGFRQ